MLQHCQVAGLDQCTEEAAATEQQRGSFAPDVVRGEEGEATAVSGLSPLLTEKTDDPSNRLQGTTGYLSANDLTGVVVRVLLSIIRGTRPSTDSWAVPAPPVLCERQPWCRAGWWEASSHRELQAWLEKYLIFQIKWKLVIPYHKSSHPWEPHWF